MDYMIDCWTGMDQITEKIWLGDSHAAMDIKSLRQAGITAVLNVAKDWGFSNYKDPSINYYHVGLIDGSGNEQYEFDAAVHTLESILHDGHKVLVHCHAGVSRSPTIVATYIAKQTGHSLNHSIDFVGEKRGIINPHLALRQLARKHLGET